MGGSPQITINGNTGLITGFAQHIGAVRGGRMQVEEYRNGVLLSVSNGSFSST